MKNVDQDPKIIEKFTKPLCNFLGDTERNLLIFRGVYVIFRTKNSYLRFRTQKNLKVSEHVHIHVLQHPTKFEVEIIRKKVMAI